MVARSDAVLGGLTRALFAVAQKPQASLFLAEQISAAIGVR